MGRMDEWPKWQRWVALLLGWALYLGGFWLLLAVDHIAARAFALLVVVAGLLLLVYASRAVLNERMRKIDVWYTRAVMPAFVAYMLFMLYVFPHEKEIAAPWLKAAVVLLPVLPMAFVAWAVVRYVNRCDEMERRQHLDSAGIAVVVVGLVSMALGFLAAAKLIVVNGALMLLMVFPALCIVYGASCTWLKWRNRAR